VKKVILFLAAVLIILLPSCSFLIGEDGDAYIAYSWVSITQVYTDDPSFGSIIYNELYEDANEGTWYFEYTSLGEFWTGTYTVYCNLGELLYDGEDIYFELWLYSFGPSLYKWSEAYARNIQIDEYLETLSSGGYTIELHAKRGSMLSADSL